MLIALIAVLVIAFPGSPAAGNSLTTKGANVSELSGNFTVILYGGRYYKDIETVAFLVPEGMQYTFEPYAPEFDYRTVKGIPAKDAFELAGRFVGAHYAFLRSQMSKVLDGSGKVIGFELRPLYTPLAFGVEDVLDIDYSIRDSKVRVYVRLKPEVDRQLFGGDGSKGRDD